MLVLGSARGVADRSAPSSQEAGGSAWSDPRHIYEQLLPITPSGLGVVEGVLIPAVVSLGASASVALLGVLTWRLVQFWLPVPLALLTYISLRVGVLRNPRSQQERLSTEQALP